MWAHEAVERPGGLLEVWPGALTEWVGLGSLRPGSRADLGAGRVTMPRGGPRAQGTSCAARPPVGTAHWAAMGEGPSFGSGSWAASWAGVEPGWPGRSALGRQ